MAGDIKAIELLAVALRSRAESVAELAEAAQLPEASVIELVDTLAERGLLERSENQIRYHRPDSAVFDHARTALHRATGTMKNTLAETQSLLTALPGLLHAWETGSADEHALPVDVLHGPMAPIELWRLQTTRGTPVIADAVLPDVSAMLQPDPEHAERFRQRMAGSLRRSRLIVSVADATASSAQERINERLDQGMQIRMLPEPPSWFWINDEETVGLPLTWGEAWPTSVMAIRSQAIASLARWTFERLWREAVPVQETDSSWEHMLILMNKGMTMEAAAHALGLSPRTGRRRVAAAMDHYGVSSLFALGAAWSASTT